MTINITIQPTMFNIYIKRQPADAYGKSITLSPLKKNMKIKNSYKS